MAVATQTTELPEVRVTPDDFDPARPLSFCGLRAVPAKHSDDGVDCRLLVLAHREPIAIAEFLIRGSRVTVATVGEIGPGYLGAITHLAKEVTTAVRCTIREKREAEHGA